MPARTPLAQMLAAQLWRVPKRLPVPALFVASRQDRITAHACSEALAKRFAAALLTHPTAGHDVTADDPAGVAKQLRAWLDEGMPGASPPR